MQLAVQKAAVIAGSVVCLGVIDRWAGDPTLGHVVVKLPKVVSPLFLINSFAFCIDGFYAPRNAPSICVLECHQVPEELIARDQA